jgi:hypothetical protein
MKIRGAADRKVMLKMWRERARERERWGVPSRVEKGKKEKEGDRNLDVRQV